MTIEGCLQDVVIKSIISGLGDLREEAKKTDSNTRYNSYKLLGELSLEVPRLSSLSGYDILLDQHLQAHLLEVNSRPSIYTEVITLPCHHVILTRTWTWQSTPRWSRRYSEWWASTSLRGPWLLISWRCFHLPLGLLPPSFQEVCQRYHITPDEAHKAAFMEELYTKSLSRKVCDAILL